jgi:cytochrome c oxidase cbb3-type subunit III
MKRLRFAPVFILTVALSLAAQGQRGNNRGNNNVPAAPTFDAAAVERGKSAFFINCGFCHGANARGGDGGPDLIRSVIVLDDEEGKELGDFLKIGRTDRGMPNFPALMPAQISDIATFLHSEIFSVSNRRTYEIQNILLGDAKAGEAFFNGAGKCSGCHSPAGDLKGIGAKYDSVTLQGRIVMPRSQRGGGDPAVAGGPQPAGPSPSVTVTFPSGQTYTGALVRITDFDVTLRESSGTTRSFTRNDETPKVEIKDPLQAHIDMLSKYKDADIHNLTAYLVTLK